MRSEIIVPVELWGDIYSKFNHNDFIISNNNPFHRLPDDVTIYDDPVLYHMIDNNIGAFIKALTNNAISVNAVVYALTSNNYYMDYLSNFKLPWPNPKNVNPNENTIICILPHKAYVCPAILAKTIINSKNPGLLCKRIMQARMLNVVIDIGLVDPCFIKKIFTCLDPLPQKQLVSLIKNAIDRNYYDSAEVMLMHSPDQDKIRLELEKLLDWNPHINKFLTSQATACVTTIMILSSLNNNIWYIMPIELCFLIFENIPIR